MLRTVTRRRVSQSNEVSGYVTLRMRNSHGARRAGPRFQRAPAAGQHS